MPSRRAALEAMLADDPWDAFLRYSLALELEKEGQHEACQALLGELMRSQSPYVPAFLMAGQFLLRQGREAEARQVFAAGIAEAQKQGNGHAAAEMGDFLGGLRAE
jgi:hypothetical protein